MSELKPGRLSSSFQSFPASDQTQMMPQNSAHMTSRVFLHVGQVQLLRLQGKIKYFEFELKLVPLGKSMADLVHEQI